MAATSVLTLWAIHHNVNGMAKYTFNDLWAGIVEEARREGPEAEEQLDDFESAFAWARELALARRKRRLSQKEVERRTGIPQSEISRIESGEANPTILTVNRLLAAYDLRLAAVPRSRRAKTGADSRT